MQGVTEWGHDALKYEAHGLPLGHALACLSVLIWLASPLTSSANQPASGVMQGVTEWGHDALNDEAHDGLSVMIWLASRSCSPLTSMKPMTASRS